MCFFTYLIILTTLVLITIFILLSDDIHSSELVGCSPEGDEWRFTSCGVRFAISFMHVFTSMQSAAMARGIFVKSMKKARATKEFENSAWDVAELP